MKHSTPIAVVGMGGLFPGASDLETFWQNIVNKIDTTCDVPDHRWVAEPAFICDPNGVPDKALSRRACLIHDVEFDPEGFDIEKDLLMEMDPLYHTVLLSGRQAFFDANIASIDRERIGTILAAIALPTDASSFIAREIVGKSFEKRLFSGSASHEIS
ncbi:beta-ketoacyl synthase N-terminal-like domain-containing protein, partial [Thermodesulfobacteriota bacterium]